ncbi:MAG: hypothetical protein ACT4P9_05145 [Betaproteobacteria bacterium]
MRTVFAVAAVMATSAYAQAPARPDPADPKAVAPARPAYESAFKGYRPQTEPDPVRWRGANDEAGRLKGHVGQVPGSVPSAGATTPKPGHAGHGGHK